MSDISELIYKYSMALRSLANQQLRDARYEEMKGSIQPIYGGFLCNDLDNEDKLETIRKKGVKVVIDLYPERTEHLYEMCRETGLEYFHYPVPEMYPWRAVADMADAFTSFSSLIDDGNFCLNGIEQADRCMYAYWAFHGIYKGMQPPPVHSYSIDSDLIEQTAHIMRSRLLEIGSMPFLKDHSILGLRWIVYIKKPIVISYITLEIGVEQGKCFYDVYMKGEGRIGRLYEPTNEDGLWHWQISLESQTVENSANSLDDVREQLFITIDKLLPADKLYRLTMGK